MEREKEELDLKLFFERRSIRKYASKPVEPEKVTQILEAGSWAPSGLNNQPWRFAVIRDPDLKKELALYTKYGRIIENAPVCILTFLDNNRSYDRTKDVQGCGACIQNMLLATHCLGLAGVWLGEILNQRQQVESSLQVPSGYELMAVIALGYPAETPTSSRLSLDQLVFLEK